MISLIRKKGTNPLTNEELYYLKSVRRSTSDTLTLARLMSESSSAYTKGEISGVTLDLPQAMLTQFLAGAAVRINGLGLFRISTTGKQTTKEEKDLTTAGATSTITFQPDSELLSQLNNRAEYEIITLAKVTAEGQQDADESDSGTDSGSGGTTTPSGTGSAD